MSLNVALLEKSFEQIQPCACEFASSFYTTLFTDYPSTQPLFAQTDMAKQEKKLLDSLVLVIQNLREPDVLTSTLRGLGARHVQYGALPEHYPLVGTALLKTFETYLGEHWTPAVKQAWVEAYNAIAQLMLDGTDGSTETVLLAAKVRG